MDVVLRVDSFLNLVVLSSDGSIGLLAFARTCDFFMYAKRSARASVAAEAINLSSPYSVAPEYQVPLR